MMCNPLRWSVLVLGLVSLGVWAESASAAPKTFFSRDRTTLFMNYYPKSEAKFNKFVNSLNSYGVDTLESFIPSEENPTLTFPGTGITAETLGVKVQFSPGFMTIGTQALLEKDTDPPFTPVNTTFNFSEPINAFGLYVIQGGDGANNNPTTFRLRDTVANTFEDVTLQLGDYWQYDNAFFFGMHGSAPFDQVEILESSVMGDLFDGMLYENVVAGFVPEPGSFALVMLGAACVLGRGARFRRR